MPLLLSTIFPVAYSRWVVLNKATPKQCCNKGWKYSKDKDEESSDIENRLKTT